MSSSYDELCELLRCNTDVDSARYNHYDGGKEIYVTLWDSKKGKGCGGRLISKREFEHFQQAEGKNLTYIKYASSNNSQSMNAKKPKKPSRPK